TRALDPGRSPFARAMPALESAPCCLTHPMPALESRQIVTARPMPAFVFVAFCYECGSGWMGAEGARRGARARRGGGAERSGVPFSSKLALVLDADASGHVQYGPPTGSRAIVPAAPTFVGQQSKNAT